MRKKRGLAFLMSVLLAASASYAGATTLDEVIINVVEGRFVCGEHDIGLADSSKPISLGYIHGEAIVQVTTPHGMEEINLGGVQVTLTQNAAPYVAELVYDLEDIPETYAVCPTCEKSTKIGNHTLLPCGHWGCKKPADHLQVCAYCYRYLCNGKDHSICNSCKVHQSRSFHRETR